VNAERPQGPKYDSWVPPSSHLERERKLIGSYALLETLDGERLETRVFTSTYFDTGDRRLLRHGVTLRRRVENGSSSWQLKLPQSSGRLEVEAKGGPLPPRELNELLTAFLGRGTLAPAATLRTRRRGIRVREGADAADVVADEVAVLDGEREVDAFDELEVEHVSGDDSLLEALERRLHDAGARSGTGEIKLERALGGAPPVDDAPPVKDAPPLAHLRWQLRTQLDAIVAHDPGVRLGTDPEDVHDLRVAIRRLRAMLRAARPMLAGQWSEPLRTELQWLGGELGPLRDADVFHAHLAAEALTLDERDRAGVEELIGLVELDRLGAHARAVHALRSRRYVAVLEELERRARAPRVDGASVPLAGIAREEFRKLRKAARRITPSASDEELHALRIRGKRARYAAELAATATGKRTRRFLKEAKRFQDVVGEHQDAVVAEGRLRALEARVGDEATFVAGRLVERERSRRERTREELPAAWRRLDRAGRSAWR
jgi:CHAD domain-containing protein